MFDPAASWWSWVETARQEEDFAPIVPIVGGPNVGKTSFVLSSFYAGSSDNDRISLRDFSEETNKAMATGKGLYPVWQGQLSHNKVKLMLPELDINEAGCNNVEFMDLLYSFGARLSGLIFMYSMTDRDSYEKLESFVCSVVRPWTVLPVFLLANKCDEASVRKVTPEEGRNLLKRIGRDGDMYQEISADTGENVKQVWLDLAQRRARYIPPVFNWKD
jgi:GTPase SAR1 family protein